MRGLPRSVWPLRPGVGLELAFSGVTGVSSNPRKANKVLEARQLAMWIFEDYTVSWYWIVM